MNELIDAAARYVGLGLRVIALTGKAPNGAVHPRGLYNAFAPPIDTPELVRDVEEAFRHTATTGIGILTGPVYYVVDIDGEEGARAWRDLAGDDFIPDRWVARTGRGLHLWFADPREWRTTKLAEKLDFKGVGGYVAAPPSLHPDGHRYEWLRHPTLDSPPLEFPPSLLHELQEREQTRAQRLLTRQMRKPVAAESRIEGVFYPDGPGLDGIIKGMAECKPGNRNAYLYWAAMTMVEDGAGEADLIRLGDAALKAGLDLEEAQRTIGSALRNADE